MKAAIVLTCHSRTLDLLCHTDILKFCPTKHDIIVIYSGDKPLPVEHHKVPAQNSVVLGAALAFVESIKVTLERGYDLACYRNGDDWLFKHELVAQRFDLAKLFDFTGYNWFGSGKDTNIALNEIYFRPKVFENYDFPWWEEWLRQNITSSCEAPVAKFLNMSRRNWYRLLGREKSWGVGAYYRGHTNNRNVCMPWLMISAHDEHIRWNCYQRMRPLIPYAEDLEKCEWFGQWVQKNTETYGLKAIS
jgi:hypothetical protein